MMEIEFNGISADSLREICSSHNIKVDIMPLAARDTVCARKEVREFGGGSGSYMAEESCCQGYYYCGHYDCGRSTKAPSTYTGGRGSSRRTVRGSPKGRSSNDCSGSGNSCNTTGDCDSSSDSAGALVIFFLIVILFFAIIYLLPVLIPIVAVGFEFVLAMFFGLFNVISFGIFRKKFRRVLVYFSDPSNIPPATMHSIIVDVANFGGLPRRYRHRYDSNGFWLLRTGAYLFLPSLVTTLLVLYLQPDNGLLFRLPIVTFIAAIVLIWIGNLMIKRKTRSIAQSHEG
ncbi:MAG: hypothetical protein KAT16_03045 [Candidatus Heimdallarchaeota archaeon]|nr:hypothetical protein [Candidatus Heimdallarchaeota archaeon]